MHEIDNNQQLRCIPIDDVVPTFPVVVEIIDRVFAGDEEGAWPPVRRVARRQGFQTIDELTFVAACLIDAKLIDAPTRDVG